MRIGLALDVSGSGAPAPIYVPTLDYNYASTMALGGLETFSRASIAYSYNNSGVLVAAPLNLALQSQTLDNASWSKLNSTVTANGTTAPDGTTTADKLIEDSTVTAVHNISQSMAFTGATVTASVYAKADTRTRFRLLIKDNATGTNSVFAVFDLSAGSVAQTSTGGTGTGATAAITSVGSGWYRCTVSGLPFAGAATGRLDINLISSGTTASYTGDGASGLYLWGAQVEISSSVTSYIPTTTATAYGPRFDYDPSTVRTNLALRSAQQDVSGVWTAAQIAVTADTVTDPLGTTAADTFTENSGSTSRGTSQNITVATNVTQTFSVYAKAGTRSWLRLMLNTGPDSVIGWFNLGSGVVGSTQTEGTGSSPSIAITDAGSGWYRCSLTGIPASADSGTISAFIRMATQDNEFSYQGNGAGTVHVWGAQLELGSTATAYIATTSAAVTTSTARGLLMEETRTNLQTRSEALDDASYTKQQCTVTANAATAPDGAVTADKLIEDSSTAVHRTAKSVTGVNAVTYTVSVYAKAAERSTMRIEFYYGTAAVTADYNLSTGVVSATSGSPEASLIQSVGNGWYRCSVTKTATGTGLVIYYYTQTGSYAGNGTSGIYVWGGQCEAGAFPTSYIPTTSASVARAADLCTISTLGSWWNASAGTLVGEWVTRGVKAGGVQTVASIDDGTTANRISIFITNTTGQPQASGAAASVTFLTAFRAAVAVAFASEKMAIGWDATTSRSYLNGAFLGGGTGGAPVATQFRLGHRTTDQLNGWLRRVTLYDTRVVNATMISITT